jgi:type I restriction enzyme S subunit
LLKEKRQAVISHAVTKGLDPAVPMKHSGVEWLGDVPAHWELKRLKHIVLPIDGVQMGPFGGMLTDLSHEPSGFKLYGQENTISGDFTRGNRWLRQDQFDELKRYEIVPGNLVLTRKGSLGGCRVVPEDIVPGIADSDTIRLRVDPVQVSSSFVQVLLREAAYTAIQTELTKRGAILAGLNTEVVANLCLVVPPPKEQQDILAFIDEITARIDALLAEADRGIALLQERRAALISAAVTGKIDVRSAAPQQAQAA